jgi:hypothetical protein
MLVLNEVICSKRFLVIQLVVSGVLLKLGFKGTGCLSNVNFPTITAC